MDTNEMLARAQQMDLNRQRQVEAAKAVTNRLLEARESEDDDAALIKDLCEERRLLEEDKMRLQAKIDEAISVANVASANGDASEIVHNMAKILSEPA